jgi:hypothetical protein
MKRELDGQMIPKKYRLNDGSIYWHKLYFNIVPKWMTKYSPPLGDYNYAAYLYQPQKYLIALYDHAKWFIQRGYRGYSDSDVWDLASYLSGWMPDALKQLERTKHGTPIGMTPNGWATRLRLMREGFVAVKEMDNLVFEDYKPLKRKMDKGLKMFAKHFLDLWD